MFNLFKKKCSACKAELAKDNENVQAFGKKFCSENCRRTYKKTAKKQSKSSCGCCS